MVQPKTVREAVAGLHGLMGAVATVLFVLKGPSAWIVVVGITAPAFASLVALLYEVRGARYLMLATDALAFSFWVFAFHFIVFGHYPLEDRLMFHFIGGASLLGLALTFHPALRTGGDGPRTTPAAETMSSPGPAGETVGDTDYNRAARLAIGAVEGAHALIAAAVLLLTLSVVAESIRFDALCQVRQLTSNLVASSPGVRARCIPTYAPLLIGASAVAAAGSVMGLRAGRGVSRVLMLTAGLLGIASGLLLTVGIGGRMTPVGLILIASAAAALVPAAHSAAG